jgi:hypothetical protein
MAAVLAARMVARLAGPLPVRLVAVSSPQVTSRTWWCAWMGRCSRTSRASSPAVASALVKLVTAETVSREVVPVAISRRQRVIVRAWRARGNSRWLRRAAFRVRVPARPCPLLAGRSAGRDLPPGQGPDPGVRQRLGRPDDRDVLRFVILHQLVRVRPHGRQGVEGHHGAGRGPLVPAAR